MPPKIKISPIRYIRDYMTDQHDEAVMHWIATDSQGNERSVFPPRNLQIKPSELLSLLLNAMANFSTDQPPSDALQVALKKGPEQLIPDRITELTGWFPPEAPTAFVLPHRTIGVGDVVHREAFGKVAPASQALGTLPEWRSGLANACRSSPHLTFALSLAFAAPTLRSAGGTGLLFNLAGESGAGKTLCLRAMQSAIKRVANTDMTSADITEAGLEQQSLHHNDLPMCIDGFGAALSTPKQASSLILRLSYGTREGRGKTRSSVGQKTLGYTHATWRVAVMTSSENTLDAMMGDEKREAGAQMRYVDIPVPPKAAGGAFPMLRRGGAKKPIKFKRLCREVDETISANYGLALPAFIEALVADPKHLEALATYRREMLDELARGGGEYQRRFLESFAKVYAAGRLAAELKITPFTPERVKTSVLELFKSVCTHKAVTTSHEAHIQALIALGNDPTRCVSKQRGTKLQNIPRSTVAVRVQEKEAEVLFVPASNLSELPPGKWEVALERLFETGVLRARPKCKTVQKQLPGLVEGVERVSGYEFDWNKLLAFKTTEAPN